MQTFRISKTQEQSYYAIRIFGIVHLIGATGLIVLLDGPGDGLHGFSWALISVCLVCIAWLSLQVVEARRGRLKGHYVLTRNTLAILLPGEARRFIHRKDCVGYWPAWKALDLRNRARVSLRSPGSKPYLKELVSSVGALWWPALHGTPLWDQIVHGDPEGVLDLRLDFRGHADGRNVILVYTRGRGAQLWNALSLAGFVLLFCVFLSNNYSVLREAGDMLWEPRIAMDVIINGVLNIAGGVGALAGLVYTIRHSLGSRAPRTAYVLSPRSLAVLGGGKPAEYFQSDRLRHFSPTGELQFAGDRSLLAAPHRCASVYLGMLRCLFTRWRPGLRLPILQNGRSGTITPLYALWNWWVFVILTGPDPDLDRMSRHSESGWGDASYELFLVGIVILAMLLISWHYIRREQVMLVDVSPSADETRRKDHRGSDSSAPTGNASA